MNFFELKSRTSVEGAEIKAFKHDLKGQKHLYLMAGVHGDEVEGVYILKELFAWLKSTDEAAQVPLIVIPVLNVDGYRTGTRTNSNGVDLNRNLPSDKWTSEARDKKYNPGTAPLSEPENLFLVKLFDKYPPHLVISFHSWVPMLNWNGKNCQKYAEYLAKYNNYPVVADIDGHPTPGSLGEFGPQKYNASVLTFEAPTISETKTLKQIWEENQTGLKALLSSKLIQSMN